MTAETAFAPLPVRRRDTLEIFDTALKLYRRYFWVLLAWSAIATLSSYVASFATCGIPAGYFFTMPLMVGATACAIAAAVRGQNITFSQCWRFFKPRYWPTVGQYVLVSILAGLGFIGLTAIGTIGGILVAAALNAASVPTAITVVVWIMISVLLLGIGSVLGSAIFCWMYMVPIIVCLEDDKRGGLAQSRAWDLLRKEWLRATMLFALIGLAFLATAGITFGFAALLTGLDNVRGMMNGGGNSTAFLLTSGVIWTLMTVVTMPLFYLCTGVFYLDLRVRKEALDLEWNAHVSAPQDQVQDTAAEAVYAPAAASTGAMDVAPATFAAGAAAGQFSSEPPPTPVPDSGVPVEPQPQTDGVVSRSVFDNPVPAEAAPTFGATGGETSSFAAAPAPAPVYEAPAPTFGAPTPEPTPEPAFEVQPPPAALEPASTFGVEPTEPMPLETSSFGTEPSSEPVFSEPSSFGGSSFSPGSFFDSGTSTPESSFAGSVDTPPATGDSTPNSPDPSSTN